MKKQATAELIQAGIAAGLDLALAEKTVNWGISAGKKKEEQALADQQRQNTPVKEVTSTG